MKMVLINASFIFLLFFITSCLPESSERKNTNFNDIEIIKGKIGDYEYFVPKSYFKIEGQYFLDNSIYLQTIYPNFLPLSQEPQRLWEEGVWWKNVSVLAKHYHNGIDINSLAEGQIDFLDAYDHVNDKYGLIHQRQPDGYIQDKKDIWLLKNKNRVTTFVVCSESLTDQDFPQCTQHYKYRNFRVDVRYDKRLLPHWQRIYFSVQNMFESFNSAESAREFVRRRTLEFQNEYEGDNQ